MTPKLTIRPMTSSEVQLALDWAAQEGWNPGLHDATSFYATDPAGFLIAELEGEQIGCISVVRYNSKFGFIGLYIVKPQWRGLGYGLQLWQTAWQQLISRLDSENFSIGLDGVLEKESTYHQAGFTAAYRHVRYVYEPISSNSVPSDVISLTDVPLKQIILYDTKFFPASRPQFLSPWIHFAEAAYGIVSGDRLCGYGVLRSCRQGFKIGPLFADTFEIADSLFRALTYHAEGQPVFIDIPDVQPALPVLIQRYCLESVFTCVRMYRGNVPNLDVERIFGVTTLELG
ncbi:GCN5-related N-acetyltransferase [Stanieria cyanosphaera PCC 7437]|uniref:GCN5-related N-acetyltransferase n=1 Tax=Stanieria cyanosphaera (strain ATCC 29371 / PCC 7437) TaxID=111780 RepID=K9XUJ4_STAC7|nr:GNAT family N-acetyltransferase [Stanieria cyanosphaera]AFZ35342.1 GCN5-related N-acetyltransferase [Stanieria cyanosphaera PCC 7437]